MIYLNGKTEKDYNANFIHFECSSPEPKLELIEVPLRDGYINATPILSDEIVYNSRMLTIGLELRSFRQDWARFWSRLLRDLHGQEVVVSRSEDPNYFWIGTATVGPLEDHGSTAGVTITVNAQPFKRTQAWIFDERYTLSGDQTITINIPFMRGYPEFVTSGTGFTVTYAGETWTLASGTSTANGLHLSEGDNAIMLHGAGTIKVRVRGGTL